MNMNSFIDNLRQKRQSFSITVTCDNLEELILECFLLHPELLSTLDTLSYRYIVSGNRYTIDFAVGYHVDNSKMTFVVCDEIELIIAVSMMLKSHKDKVKIIIDNRNSFSNRQTIIQHIRDLQSISGVEFELGQRSMSSSLVRSFFDEKILVCELSYQYFDDAFLVNQLSCIVAEHCIKTAHIHGEENTVNYLLKWFRDNVRYKDNDLQSDHSAVGLIKNGTAVCQAIAVYAYLFLNRKGVHTRYVCGEGDGSGGWGDHAWNLSLIHGSWTHIDYTFELSSFRHNAIKSISEFEIDHRWEKTPYNTENSNKAKNTVNTLKSSIVTVLPNQKLFSINGVIVYIPSLDNVAPAINGKMYISVFDIFPFFDICFNISNNGVVFYVGIKKYSFPLSVIQKRRNTLFFPIELLMHMGLKVSIDNHSRITVSI